MSTLGRVSKNMFKLVLSLAVIITVIASIVFYNIFVSSPMADVCGVDVVEEVYSGNNELRAVLYQFDCGAMDSFSTQVSLLSGADELPNKAGNVFSAKHSVYRGEWGGPYTEISWLSDNELLISYAEDSEILQEQVNLDSVTVTYKKIPVDTSKVEESVLDEFMKAEGISSPSEIKGDAIN